MENNNTQTFEQYPGEKEAIKHYKWERFKEIVYRFFYNIWPAVSRVLSFFFYHLLRIIKGSVKIAMEQMHQG